jgi:hyaluronan synthase
MSASPTPALLSHPYRPGIYRPPRRTGLEPRIAVIIPAYNEGRSIRSTLNACLAVEYPMDRCELVCIDDGSEDETWAHITRVAEDDETNRIQAIRFPENRGKRAAMAAGVRATDAEILIFVDSDSQPAPDAFRLIVQGFVDPHVGAVSGMTHARNASSNVLTKMQATRYYVSFQLLKSAESVLGAVACCSGCFAAYRRSAVLEVLDRWESQRFLGVACTYGDDRALTNMILRESWTSRFDAEATAWTQVPERYGIFFRQQLRWKKSWAREGPILLSHLWRMRPLAFLSFTLATLSGLLSPLILVWNLVAGPGLTGSSPIFYLLALYLVSAAYALFHRAFRDDGLWKYSIIATFFYISFALQLVWAVARIRDGRWGTRDTQGPPSGDDRRTRTSTIVSEATG